jgi:futalosine hydrolase
MEVTGFGPVAAGIGTMRLLGQGDYAAVRRLVLVGIGGTFDQHRLPPGSAVSFRHVSLWGVGAGSEENLQTPVEMQIPQLTFADGEPCYDTLPLVPWPRSRTVEGLLTVAAAADGERQVALRRQRFGQCICEDMEGFPVAIAARQYNLPLSIIRGISNVAGDRARENWRIEDALQAAARLLQEGF